MLGNERDPRAVVVYFIGSVGVDGSRGGKARSGKSSADGRGNPCTSRLRIPPDSTTG
jgi:hypothetical protein